MTRPSAASPAANRARALPFDLPPWAGLAIVALVTLVAYWPALGGARLWDDNSYIPQPSMRSWNGLFRIWTDFHSTQQYFPLLFTSFWLEHWLWGDHMLGYHLVNLALHIGAACLVFTVLRQLKIPGAFFATALFAVHPLHVESVAWVTEQKNTLSAVFYLSSMLVYLRFDESRSLRGYALALVLFVLALMSKSVTVTLPPALLVIFWWQRGTLSKDRDVLPLVPFFGVAVAYGVLTTILERYVLGAEGTAFSLTIPQAILCSGRALWFYFGKIVWPTNFIFIYPRWDINPSDPWQWFYPLAALAVLAALWAIRRQTRAPLAGALYFAGTLFPLLGFLNVYFFRYSYVSDHFCYLATLGIVVPFAGGVTWFATRQLQSVQRVVLAGCLLLVGVLAVLTFKQSQVYANPERLYQTTIDRNPEAWMAYNNLGGLYFDQGDSDKAVVNARKALQIKPDLPEAYNNLGNVALRAGKFPEALELFQKALQIKPNFTQAKCNLGVALASAGRPQDAEELFQEVLHDAPDFYLAYYQLGNLAMKAQRFQQAVDYYQQAVQINPVFAEARTNLAAALFQVGLSQEGLDQFSKVARLTPDDADAWVNLAAAQAQLNHSSEALAAAEEGLKRARSQNNIAGAQKIEEWLTTYRASQRTKAP